jgi:3-hydroxy-9,10-secoandrosta-1,3,5(10)-triene-9,17-dione monooxygenase reductase component
MPVAERRRTRGNICLPPHRTPAGLGGGGVAAIYARAVAAIDRDSFRAAMGLLPTGVTVVTALGPNGRAGATASAVGSLSLEPMLMLACLDRGSRTLRTAQEAGRFGIDVLAAQQQDVARQFSTKLDEDGKWRGVGWSDRGGIPALDETVLWVGCELQDVLMGGDHVILTGAVVGLDTRGGEPLVHHRGSYRALG